MSQLKFSLRLAGIYNILWGAWIILFPHHWWNWMEMPQPNYPQIWQCLGMVIGVYGIGYWIAARDPIRHWVIILVGFLGKVLGPIGALLGVYQGTLPPRFLLMNITNDVIWWIPFALILMHAWRSERQPNKPSPA